MINVNKPRIPASAVLIVCAFISAIIIQWQDWWAKGWPIPLSLFFLGLGLGVYDKSQKWAWVFLLAGIAFFVVFLLLLGRKPE